MIWFGWVLWHINHCRLFNAKFFLYIYIKYMISKYILFITFLNKPEIYFFAHSSIVSLISIKYKYFYLLLIIYLHTVKWFQVLLLNTNNSIKHWSFVYT